MQAGTPTKQEQPAAAAAAAAGGQQARQQQAEGGAGQEGQAADSEEGEEAEDLRLAARFDGATIKGEWVRGPGAACVVWCGGGGCSAASHPGGSPTLNLALPHWGTHSLTGSSSACRLRACCCLRRRQDDGRGS